MIECKNLTKQYAGMTIIKDLSICINDGEFVCFSGKSGAGKTTLLNMLGLLEEPTSGEILFDGKQVRKNREKLRFFREKVGFIFQNFALVEGKTVKQNLNMVQKKYRNKDVTIDMALNLVGLSHMKNSKVYTLSGGEQQRVALARLYIKQCDIILADEPTGSLDKENATIVLQILRQLNDAGKTIILVTHDLEIKKQCDRIIELPERRRES